MLDFQTKFITEDICQYDHSALQRYLSPRGFTCEKHPEYDIYIYGYHSPGVGKKNWDKVSSQMRGLILDKDGKILARPFPKFFTFKRYLSENTVLLTEGQIRQIPSEDKYKIYEKLDGSMAVLYWMEDMPYLASQRSFTSKKAKKATEILHRKYSGLFHKLDRNKTYLFEAIYPEARVGVDYGNVEDLFLIGTIDTISGKNIEPEDIGFPLVKDYTEQLNEVKDLNSLQALNIANMEGLVLVYESGLRIKIKFSWFLEASKTINRLIALENAKYQMIQKLKRDLGLPVNRLTNKNVWELLDEGVTIDQIKNQCLELYHYSGVREWLDTVYQEYADTITKINNNGKKQFNMPDTKEFDFKKQWQLPSSEMIMWNKIQAISKFFD